MQATVLGVFGDLFVRLSVFAMVHALASLWIMHNTRMEKQINLINTFKRLWFFLFSILSHIWPWKGLFWVTLTLYKTNPSRTVSWRENTTKRGIIWFFVTFICKVLKFSFLDGGYFGGLFEFVQPQILEVEIKIVFNLSKPCSVPNIKLVSIWDT